MAILSKGCKPDNFQPHNSLKPHNLSALQIFEAFIQILLNVNLSLNQTPDILALFETNLDDSVDPGNFSVRGVIFL